MPKNLTTNLTEVDLSYICLSATVAFTLLLISHAPSWGFPVSARELSVIQQPPPLSTIFWWALNSQILIQILA